MSSEARNAIDAPINARQVARIERLHQGFLYQHLYALQALLSQSALGWDRVRIERDEDIEIDFTGVRAYVQVKKRTSALAYSDVEGNVQQFIAIRAEHQPGKRWGSPHLWLVSNAPLSENLAARVSNPEWPDDVFLRTPTYTRGTENVIPLPGATIEEQFQTALVWHQRSSIRLCHLRRLFGN